MGRIKKVAGPKHEATISPALSGFVQKSIDIPLVELPTHLSTFPRRWPFPRGDLYHWIGVLNRFDDILALVVEKYALNHGPQVHPFGQSVLLESCSTPEAEEADVNNEARLNKLGFGPEGDRELVEAILDFSRLLLDKCGNRSLFSSSERLSDLLNTTSLSLLQCTLRLGVCLAQRYHSRQRSTSSSHFHQSLLAAHYNIDLDKVQALAAPFSRPSQVNKTSDPSSPAANIKGKEKALQGTYAHQSSTTKSNADDMISLTRDGTEGNRNAADASGVPGQWDEWGHIRLSYYPPTSPDQTKAAASDGPSSSSQGHAPSTPSPAQRGPVRLNRISSADESPGTLTQSPSGKSEEARGMKVLEIPNSKIASSKLEQLLKSNLSELPYESIYELLHKLRVAKALTKSPESRHQLLSIRILAITNLAYIYPDNIFQQKILQQDSDEPKRLQIAYQLAELVHLGVSGDINAPTFIQISALNALDALAKQKSRSADVCAALNVNVNHGILMFIIRKAVADLGIEDDPRDSGEGDDWRDALFALLRTLPGSSTRTPETLVSAGLIPMLVEVLNLRTEKARRVFPRVMEFLDTFVHAVRDALTTLANAKGLDAISDLISFEAESSFNKVSLGNGIPAEYKTPTIDYRIPYFQQQTLRWLFKFVNHIMQHNGGGFDRLLRNFIDSPPLLGALRLVFENVSVFGSHVWSGAVNILSSFIHNEPTSYQVIAEAGLSKSFLEAIMDQTVPEKPESPHQEELGESSEAAPSTSTTGAPASSEQPTYTHELLRPENVKLAHGILPATEAIGCIPQAFGAISLNSGGLELFKSSNALESFFEIFESPEHVKCMKNDANLLRVLGGSFDELVRHHPALKSAVMSAVLVMVARVSLLCKSKAWESGLGTKLWTEDKGGKQCVAGGVSSLLGEVGAEFKQHTEEDQPMTVPEANDVELPSGNKIANGPSGQFSWPKFDTPSDKEQDKHGLTVANYMYPVMKFLGAFFDNQTICTYFIEAGGVEYVLDYATLQSLPFDFHNNTACPELAQVIHLMAETKPHLVLPSLVKRTQTAVDKLEQFWGESRTSGFFSSLTLAEMSESSEETDEVKSKGTYFAKHLAAVHTLMDILREVFTPPIYPTRPSQQVSPFIQVNMADMYTSLARRLGLLHASCVWEEILLQKSMPESWNEATKRQGSDTKSSDSTATELPGSVNTATVTQAVPVSTAGASAPSSGNSEQPRPATSPAPANAENGPAFKNVQTLRYLLSSLPLSITEFLHILGHGLVSKRRMDSYQRQNSTMVADAIASTVLEQLDLDAAKNSGCVQDRFSYLIVILSSFSKLLFETTAERPHTHCLTMILFSFKRLDGIQVMKGLFELFLKEIKDLGPKAQNEDEPQDAPARRASAYGAIKIILTFFSEITSASYIMNSSQTQAMTSSERDKDRPDYFLPAQFLVELRMEVLPVVSQMWGSELVDQSSSSIVKRLIEIMRSILESEHEAGAFKRSDNPPAISTLLKKPFPLVKEKYASLKEKGYDKALAREALFRCNNGTAQSEEYCKAQKGLRAPPRVPMPSNELETSPASSGTPLTEAPSSASTRTQPPAGDSSLTSSTNQLHEEAITSLLGAIQAAQPNVAGEETQPGPSSGVPAHADNTTPEHGANSTGHMAMSIDNILNDQEAPRSQDHGSTNERPAGTTETVPTPKPEPVKRREVVTIEDLDDGRDQIRADLIECCLDVLNVHHDVTFELSDLILAATKQLDSAFTFRKEVGETLVQSLISLQMEENFELVGKKISAYANLLALVLQDKQIYDVTLEELKNNFSTLLGFIKVSPNVPSDKSAEPTSPWVGQVLLILEKVLSDDAQPSWISWNPPNLDDPNPSQPIAEVPDPLVPMDEKKHLFEAIVDVLPRIGKDTSLALSVSRVLVILTRDRDIATQLAEKRNLQRLFVMMKQLSGSTNEKLQSTFMLILRHIVEDDETIRQIMHTEIVAVFNARPTRHTDTSAYIRQLYHLALRSPKLFVEVTNEKLKLTRYETHQRPQGLMLKVEKDDSSNESGETQPEDAGKEAEDVVLTSETIDNEATEKLKAPELKAPVVENPGGVIHYLLSELLSYKDVDDKEPTPDTGDKPAAQPDAQGDIEMSSSEVTTTTTTSPASNLPSSRSKKADKPQFKADEHPIYIYRCFLLQCLTELLSSYNRTKVEFINFSRKADPMAATPSKPRSGILNYMLNALIPIGTLEHDDSIAFKKRNKTSDWAMQVVVALCAKTGEFGVPNSRRRNGPEDESEPDLLFVRKFVLEHALKSYRDANASNESLDVKYARLMCLADLFDKMLSGGSTPDSPGAHVASSTKQVAKTMFEKNFISAFTASISDIDLNFPLSKRAVKYILRPLNKLTQTAVVLSESSSIQNTPGQTDEDEISSATSVSDIDDEREETPDLFRHSTLGMFDPNQEEATSSEESENEDDDEMYDDEYADDMDYDEELPENDGEVVSDEDEDIHDRGPIEGLPGDPGMDIEVLIEGDEDGEDDDDEDDDEDDDDEDDDSDMDEDEIMAGEITGDNPDHLDHLDHEDDWESDDMSEGDEGEMMNQLENEFDAMPQGGGRNDRPRFENLLRVLEEAGGDIEHIDDEMGMGGGLQGDLIEDDMDEDEEDDEEVDELEDELDELEDDQGSYHEFDDDEPDLGNPPMYMQDPIAPRGQQQRFRGVPPPWTIGMPHRHGVVPIPPYRSQRSQIPPRGADDGTNPLLIRNDRPGDAPRQGRGANTEAFSDWVHAIDPSAQGRLLSVDSPVSFMNAIMQAMGQGGAGFGVVSRPDGFHVHLDRRSILPNRIQDLFGLGAPPTAAQPSRDDPSQVVTFAFGSTISRWQEETRLLFGGNYHDKSQRIHNSLLQVLVPPAIEEEKIRRKEAQEEQKRREEEQAERERVAKEEAEKEKKRKEEEEAALARQQELEREAEAEAQPEAVEEPSAGAEPMDDVQPTEPSTEVPATGDDATEPGQSEPTTRVRTTIRGRQLDITGMDIDPEYLEALPEEIREEVIMQQYAQQRTQAAASGEEPSEINPEFLEALPAEIREELLQQEAADRRRRERETARRQAASTESPAHAEDMDPASFIATLDPSLRQAVLADQPEEILASLGPEYVSEARALTGGRRMPQFNGIGGGLDPRARAEVSQRDQSTKKPQRKQIVQMLDKAGVATLLRLMFMPLQGNARHHLDDILHNVCENRQTRTEVVGLLLLILQDGSADVNAIERSFAHLSLRAKTPASQKTPQPLKRTLSLQSTPGANSDVTPLMVVQQCLITLSFLTQYNPHIAWFFLSEHDPSSTLKLRAFRKGKGKENRANKFALNALLSLLDRKPIMESPNCMEQLSSLLANITQPLTMLLRKEKEKQHEESKPEEGERPAAAGTTEDQASQAAAGATSGEATATSDTTMTDAPTETQPEGQSAEGASGQTGEVTGEGQAGSSKPAEGEKSKKPRTIEPPVVPEHNLRLVVHILSARECNGKTFRETLSTINNLSAIPGAKESIGKELINQAQGLSQSILVDLDDLLPHIRNAHTGTDVQGMTLSKFSPASSDQSKLLRVLTALDYLFDPSRADKDKGAEPQSSDNKEDVLKSLYESSKFNPLWNKLSECLTAIRKKEKMLNVATILLPLIEALMVVCKNTTLKDVPVSRHGRDFSVSSPPPENGMEGLFFNFTEEHRKVLNELVRQNPKLMSGTFSLLVKNPKVLEFDNKRNYFTRRLHSRGAEARHPHPPLQLAVRRDQVFLDSFKSLYFKSADEMKYGKLNIRFHGEEGVDAGGVSREWFQVLARGMFNPNYALFIPVASDRTTFHPNRLSGVNQEHLMFFKFIGRIIGKALYEGRVLDCHFSRAVYKRILGKSVSIKDMETLDLDYYKSLLWMLENDITDIITENFSVETDDFGEKQVIDLIEGGHNIPVTQENKEEYVQRVVEYRLTGSVKEQLDNFLRGFHDIVPAELISIFSEQELELLISGLPEIDVDDWKNNSEYHNYSASSSQIQWFWRAVRSFDKEERAKLLQFVSGTSKVPLNGFKELEGMNGFSRFNIHRDYGHKDRLPSSHTCFNQLDLPEYDSYEVLRERLYTAMTAGGEYFGFA